MKRSLILLSLLTLLLAACGSTDGPEIVAPSIGEAEPAVVASAAEDATSVPIVEQSDEAEPVTTGSVDVDMFVPATAVADAAVVRVQDHVLGSEDPVVAIIEYGDYQ